MGAVEIVLALLGSSAAGAIVTHLLGRRRRTAETSQIITSTATELVREMRAEIMRLSTDLAAARTEIAELRAELASLRDS